MSERYARNGRLHKAPPVPPKSMFQEKRFDILKLRYDDQVTLLRKLTDVNLQVFGGYLTLSLAFGSWVSQHPIKDLPSRGGLTIISLTLAIATTTFLLFNAKRREEIVATVRNLNEALGYESVGLFLPDQSINAKTKFRPWRNVFFLCIWSVFAGTSLLVFAQSEPNSPLHSRAIATQKPVNTGRISAFQDASGKENASSPDR